MTQPDDRAREAARAPLDKATQERLSSFCAGRDLLVRDYMHLAEVVQDAIEAATRTQAAQCEKLEAELAWIDETLARRSAIDDLPTRREKIERTLSENSRMNREIVDLKRRAALSKPEGGG